MENFGPDFIDDLGEIILTSNEHDFHKYISNNATSTSSTITVKDKT